MQQFPNAAVQMGAGALRSLELPSNEAESWFQRSRVGLERVCFQIQSPKSFCCSFCSGERMQSPCSLPSSYIPSCFFFCFGGYFGLFLLLFCVEDPLVIPMSVLRTNLGTKGLEKMLYGGQNSSTQSPSVNPGVTFLGDHQTLPLYRCGN